MARAPALHAGGQGFDSLILHQFVAIQIEQKIIRHTHGFTLKERERPDLNREGQGFDSLILHKVVAIQRAQKIFTLQI